jgi:hypothetical protein
LAQKFKNLKLRKSKWLCQIFILQPIFPPLAQGDRSTPLIPAAILATPASFQGLSKLLFANNPTIDRTITTK